MIASRGAPHASALARRSRAILSTSCNHYNCTSAPAAPIALSPITTCASSHPQARPATRSARPLLLAQRPPHTSITSSSSKRSVTAMASTGAAAAPDIKLEQVAAWKQFGGWNKRFKYRSPTLGNTDTVFTVYLPPQSESKQVPVIFYLSGLTCTDENFIQKAGAQRAAAELGVALVAPDTSPRGLNVPGEAEAWDFGVGAGFYLNATQEKWAAWRMYDFVLEELPAVLGAHLSSQLDLGRASIMGHSMGGHGALVLALRNPGRFKSVSAFAPICNPTAVPWGVKAFTGYLGEDRSTWAQYDATELLRAYKGTPPPMLIDQGTADSFLATQLAPHALEAAAQEIGFPLTVRMQEGYDHSYFFISSFVPEHVAFHAKALAA